MRFSVSVEQKACVKKQKGVHTQPGPKPKLVETPSSDRPDTAIGAADVMKDHR